MLLLIDTHQTVPRSCTSWAPHITSFVQISQSTAERRHCCARAHPYGLPCKMLQRTQLSACTSSFATHGPSHAIIYNVLTRQVTCGLAPGFTRPLERKATARLCDSPCVSQPREGCKGAWRVAAPHCTEPAQSQDARPRCTAGGNALCQKFSITVKYSVGDLLQASGVINRRHTFAPHTIKMSCHRCHVIRSSISRSVENHAQVVLPM